MDDRDGLRLADLVAAVRSGTACEVLGAADLVAVRRHCTFMHGAVLLFPPDEHEVAATLAKHNAHPVRSSPSVVVRNRLASRFGVDPQQLPVSIVHAAFDDDPDGPELELFVLIDDGSELVDRIAAVERAENCETHIAFRVETADDDTVAKLGAFLTRQVGLIADGNGYNEHDDVSIRYFRGNGRLHGKWPRRIELFAAGRHEPAPEIPARADTEQTWHTVNDLLTGAWRTQAVRAAAELGLADLLHHGVTTVGGLAAMIGAPVDPLGRLLRYLECLGLVVATDGSYRLTPAGARLRTGVDGSMADMALLFGGVFYDAFAELPAAIRAGENAFTRAFGAPPFTWFNRYPEQAGIFTRAMAAGSAFLSAAAEGVDLTGVSSAVDVGGGDGTLLGTLLARDRELRGVLVEREQVLDAARVTLAPVLARCELVSGDFTEPLPDGHDLYLLTRILHDWDDDRCVAILSRCREAMATGTRLVVVERPIPDDGPADLALAYDIHMMVNNDNGRERTRAEYRNLLERTGFELTGEQQLPLGMALMSAVAIDA